MNDTNPGISQPHGELSRALFAVRRAFYAVAAFSLAINLLLLVPAVYMLQIYDRVLSSRNLTTLAMLTLIMLGLYLLEAALEFVRSSVLIRAGAALDLEVNARVFQAAFERYLRRRGGNPGQAFGDLASIRQFLTGKGLLALCDAPWTPIYVIVIFLLNAWLGLFALVAAAVLLSLAWLNERLTAVPLAEAGQLAAAASQEASAQVRNVEAIEAMGMLPNLQKRWLARQQAFLALQAAASDRAAWVSSVTRFARLAMQSGILGAGALLVIDNQLSAGGMIAASILLGRALSPVELAISTWRNVVAARSAYARVSELLEAHPQRGGSLALPRPHGRVRAENLVVGSPSGGAAILKGISFEVQPGSIVAVVGASAAGKSTLARALVGVWTPSSGTLRLDGAEVHAWNKDELGPWIGYLPQDVELFEGSVADNIARFGERDAALIVQAAQRAGVHEMVLQLPQGYDTKIGEGGAILSGGQRQRVALARALYGDPALIVLDEPNANLDDAGDAALHTALRAMKREGRTVFVMTHRVNVLRAADAVMVLAGGALQAFGPRDELLKVMPAKPRAPRESRGDAALTQTGTA